MHRLASGITYADLEFQGIRRIIATAVLQGSDGLAIVDPGPTSTLPVLTRHLASLGATVRDVTQVLLTHIHLDHAGASGTLVQQNPRIRVLVHAVGAPHVVDPSKLLASAGRLYGDQMQMLWGDVLPVPASAITVLAGGERVRAGDRDWDVAATPGHASHHVSYFSGETGVAFVGDTAGVQVMAGGFVLPPTPPPDIDIPLWLTSLDRIEAWRPASLFLTHFGPTHSPSTHLAELRDHLRLVGQIAGRALAMDVDEPAREAWFIDRIRLEMSRRMGETDVNAYQVAGRFDLNWRGLSRYLSKRKG